MSIQYVIKKSVTIPTIYGSNHERRCYIMDVCSSDSAEKILDDIEMESTLQAATSETREGLASREPFAVWPILVTRYFAAEQD
ncbi:hypothetical protein X777_05928 [Ooceraea biroi]|uniref:Uncharacterized protein n=1 Tax=Ooceraea biroi TaxID=2015173 RepID=A0A026WGA4_OOCBI|nr:hypothetical protein X777_05928 [Ooceraea biroi]